MSNYLIGLDYGTESARMGCSDPGPDHVDYVNVHVWSLRHPNPAPTTSVNSIASE
jgi:ribulose kinase